jgi:diketogulonate reductase-like aldo/keto reductase
LLDYCKEKGIRLEGWGPLTRGQRFDDPVLQSVARNTGKTPAQVLLRWQLQHGVVTIPKSAHPERIRANADLYDFAISDEDMARLDGLAEPGYSLSDWRPCPPEQWY